MDRPGGVFLRDWPNIPEDRRDLFLSAPSVVLSGNRGSLQQQLVSGGENPPPPEFVPSGGAAGGPLPAAALSSSCPTSTAWADSPQDGREYAIYLKPGSVTPAPWANVMASRDFGTMVTESGLGCTWSGNSQMNRLTPWHNDPVSDPQSEAIYLRDEESGAVWTPTPLADPRKRRVPGAPRTRLHRVRAQQPRHRPGTDGVRSRGGGWGGRSGEDLPAAAAQRFRTAAPADGHVLRGMGARLSPRRSTGTCPDRFRSNPPARSWRANAGTATTPVIRRLPRRVPARRVLFRRSHCVPWTQQPVAQACGHGAYAPGQSQRRGPRSRGRSSAFRHHRAGTPDGSHLPAGAGRERGVRCAPSWAAIQVRSKWRPPWPRRANGGIPGWARCKCARRCCPPICCSIAGSCTRR